MTALKEFERLEATGLWRPDEEQQRRNVLLFLGDATLVISDMKEMALSHWSLPALERINPGPARPALYRPGDQCDETLEIDDETMIEAIERIHAAIERSRPHPGRLRGAILWGGFALVAGLSLFWLPGAMIRYTASVVPDVTRSSISTGLLNNIRRVSGKPCQGEGSTAALATLQTRLRGGRSGQILVIANSVPASLHLPDGTMLINRTRIEDVDSPDVLAGYILAEDLRATAGDPLVDMLNSTGLISAFRLLTTGKIPDPALDTYSETLLSRYQSPVENLALLAAFKEAGVSSTPYAYAIDITGEATLPLIEADPVPAAAARPVMRDSEWVALQGICGE
jgi:hypothetical protein